MDAADAESKSGGYHAAAADDVLVFDSPVDLGPQPFASEASGMVDHDDDDIFAIPEKSGLSLPMPAIAGAIGLVVMIIIGGWFAMSGPTEPVKPETVPAVQVTQPDPVEAAPATDTIVSSQSETNSADSTLGQPTAATKTAPTKPKKTETAKAGADKKKVTVDDLINDN